MAEDKKCPVYNYDCEAYNGKKCCLVLDENCHYISDKELKKTNRRIWKGIIKGTPLEKLFQE